MRPIFLSFVLALIAVLPLEGAFTCRNGKWLYVTEVADDSPETHYASGLAAYEAQDWSAAIRQFVILTDNFSVDQFSSDAYFFLGIALFEKGDYEAANDSFSNYLKMDASQRYLTETVEYKFAIAEAYREGARRRLLGYRGLPKWSSGQDLAPTIYDEVATTLPSSDLAAHALLCKGCVLAEMKDYRCSVEAFQALIRRFPRHELTPEAYLAISQVYLIQSQDEFQNPDLLVLADLSVKRFQSQFPNDERVAEAEKNVLQIKEVYAWGIYDTAQLYERTGQCRAALFYYLSVICQFPETQIAEASRKSLSELANAHRDLQVYLPADVL